MIWKHFGLNPNRATEKWVMFWLRASLLTRLLIGAALWWPSFIIVGVTMVVIPDTLALEVDVVLAYVLTLFLQCVIPIDFFVERRHVRKLCEFYQSLPTVIAVTRVEYSGGHPQLPEARFVFSAIVGHDRARPFLSLMIPDQQANRTLQFPISLLDYQSSEAKEDKIDDLLERGFSQVAHMGTKGGLKNSRLMLVVRYLEPRTNRRHEVELRNFRFGNDELEAWRNILVCAQGEAETGKIPFGKWKSLPKPAVAAPKSPSGPTRGEDTKAMLPSRPTPKSTIHEEVEGNGSTRDGHGNQPARSSIRRI